MAGKAIVAVAAVVSLLSGALWSASVGWMLVFSGLIAAVLCANAARSLAPDLRAPWLLIALGQLLNGLGNLSFVFDANRWISLSPDWPTSIVFNTATTVTVAGIIGLSLERHARRLMTVALDLLAITGCAFAIAVFWDLGRFFGHPTGADDWVGMLGYLAVVLDFLGVVFGLVIWNAQPRGKRAATRLAVVAIAAATLGDTEWLGHYFGLDFTLTASTWVVSSWCIAFAALYLKTTTQPMRWISRDSLLFVSIAFALVLLTSGIWHPDRIGNIRELILVVLIAVSARQLLIVREEKSLRRRLEVAATTDSLTGLANRSRFEAAVDQRLAERGVATVMFCDLDRFKWVNDTNGHPIGDELLAQVAERLRHASPLIDLVARFGGDEFTVLLRHGLSDQQAAEAAEQIRLAAAGHYHVGSKLLMVDVSVGVAIGHAGPTAAALMSSDLALTAAKASNKGTTLVFDQGMADQATFRVGLAARLRLALDNDELALEYQPVVDVATGELVSVEALLRWPDAFGKQTVPTLDMLEIAYSFGFISELDRWSLDRAIHDAANWEDHSVAVNVNVSSQKFADPTFAFRLIERLEQTGLQPERLIIEITEDAILDRNGPAIASLQHLRAIGVRFMVDDFGTGYSNLGYLHNLPLYGIKLDRAFVAGVDWSTDQQSITRAIVRLAHELTLVVCAEGVERPEELAVLKRLGVEFAQGYLVAPPLALDEALRI